jgi:crotonobetainyl-CoA:carnitine CoA-transferase CaiB-like acyl-CoA transferase
MTPEDLQSRPAGPLAGVKVVELASWMFVPSAGTVLVDWGADVVKVEHPVTGDPQRGLVTSGLLPGGDSGINFMMEQPNRGKRSVAIDVSKPDGHEAFMRLIEGADVYLTNYLPQVRRKLGVDVDDVRARNPRVIVARGSGQGPKGPDAEKGGYDAASFWARGGVAAVMPTNAEGWPSGQPSAAFGDVMGGLATAGAIAAALLQRERTGEAIVVDVSLLATAMWQLSPMVVAAKLFGLTRLPTANRLKNPNPGVNTYRTADDRFISLVLLQADKFWDDLATRLERPELTTDERFSTSAARAQNAAACVAVLDEAFGSRPLAHWKEVLADFAGVWTPYQTLDELYSDPQVVANGYLPAMEAHNGQQVQLVASPAQFDERPVEVRRAPEHGEHTEQVLLDAGFDWEAITAMKESRAIL